MSPDTQRRPLRNFLCGMLIGGGSILPGVSGGVLAVIFGLYRPLMDFLANPKRALQQNLSLLIPLGLGIVTGFALFAKVIAIALSGNETVTTWCFIGLIVGTLPSLEAESRKEGRTKGCCISFLVCAVVVFCSLFHASEATLSSEPSLLAYGLCGVVLGIGSVLPGLSSSSLLMALGLYTPMMSAVSTLDWSALMVFVPWTVVTLLALARGVTWLFDRYYGIAFHGILGIVLASTLVIIPTVYTGWMEIVYSGLSAIAGCGLALAMVRLDTKQ